MIRTGTLHDADGATTGSAAPVRTVTLDRPGRRNALTPAGLDQLAAAVTEAAEPVVLLRGAGGAFCAGADVAVVESLADRESATAFARHGQRVARALEDADAVVIAGIDGAVRGGGLELALACDLRVATQDATFAEPGVELGLFGAWGGTDRLPEVCGLGEAMDLGVSGRVVDAEAALRMGLVSRVVEEPAAVAREVAEAEPAAVRAVKRRLRDRGDRDEGYRDELEDREAEAFADLVVQRSG